MGTRPPARSLPAAAGAAPRSGTGTAEGQRSRRGGHEVGFRPETQGVRCCRFCFREGFGIRPPCGAETSALTLGTSLVIYNLLLLLLESKYSKKKQKKKEKKKKTNKGKVLGALPVVLYYKTVITSHQAASNFSWREALQRRLELAAARSPRFRHGTAAATGAEAPAAPRRDDALPGAGMCQGFSRWRKSRGR